jgi:hypothetical protein
MNLIFEIYGRSLKYWRPGEIAADNKSERQIYCLSSNWFVIITGNVGFDIAKRAANWISRQIRLADVPLACRLHRI